MIAGIILAAGESTRMGFPKPFIKIYEKTFFEHIINKMLTLGFNPIITVTNKRHNENWEIFKSKFFNVIFKNNPNPELGQFSSLIIAMNILVSENPKIDGALISLIDHPLVSISTYKKIIEEHTKNKHKLIIPIYEKRQGHPIFIPSIYFSEIIEFQSNSGLRDYISKNCDNVMRITIDDKYILQDIDTQDDLKKINQLHQ